MNKIELLNKADELIKKANELKELAEKSNDKEYKRWRGNKGENYYFIDINGQYGFFVNKTSETNNDVDKVLYNIGNYYKTEEEAIKARDKQLAIVRINDRIEELNGNWKPDWDDSNELKYYIYYHYADKEYSVGFCCVVKYDNILHAIKSIEVAQQIIDEMKDDLDLIFS